MKNRDLSSSIGLGILGTQLSRDVRASLRLAVKSHVMFPSPPDPLSIFRAAVSSAIRDIETHPRGWLLQRFLRDGPLDWRESASSNAGLSLSDEEVAQAVNFVQFHMVNSFQGSVAEMLAAGPCAMLVKRLQTARQMPAGARLYWGDAVGASQMTSRRRAKAADMYVLRLRRPEVLVGGAVEVKSCPRSSRRLNRQLEKHISRAQRGLVVRGIRYDSEQTVVGFGAQGRVLKVSVVPSSWRLSREIRFGDADSKGASHSAIRTLHARHGVARTLHLRPAVPPERVDRVSRVGPDTWRIVLRWSHEALAAAAFEMTFWYMSKVGEVIYSASSPWPHMSPTEAGRNAIKQALYFAAPRCRSHEERQRAVNLYNIYGFGYALGTSFRNADGERELLFPEDLDTILEHGEADHGCRIWPPRR